VNKRPEHPCTAFCGPERIAAGDLIEIAHEIKAYADENPEDVILVFSDENSRQVEIDLRGNVKDVVRRLTERMTDTVEAKPKGRGRPKLGVVSREVTLLPRHWEWLAEQPGGASVALRRLVDNARTSKDPEDLARAAKESAYRFMSAMTGNLPGYEEALRALFAGEKRKFKSEIKSWPQDLRAHVGKLTKNAFPNN